MKVDTHLNILISYAYMTSPQFCERVRQLVEAGIINVMIDSGAFTKHNAKGDFSHVNLEDYCKFLEKYGDMSEKYVMLDVVGNAEKSRANYEVMINKGLNPMFVMTMFDKDYAYMRECVKRNPNICVAGGVTTKSSWLLKRFQDIYRYSNQEAKIHGLGYVTYPKMMQLPLFSVDSSSWKAASLRFGSLQYFDNGLKAISYKDVLRGNSKLTLKQQKVLANLRISPSMFCNVEYHKGGYSIESLGGIHANITLQKVCKRNHLDYFLAVSGLQDLEKIVYVDSNYNDLSYEKFRNEFLR